MKVSVNITETEAGQHIEALADKRSPLVDKMLREVAQTIYAQMETRVFNESGTTKSDGTKIGKYKSLSYVKKRAKEYSRTNMDVNLMLTDQMHSAFTFGVSPSGSYTIGFVNDLAADKSRWNEDRFGDIFKMTKEEEETVSVVVTEFLNTHKGGKV